MLKVTDLTVRYGKIPAVSGVSLQVDEREAVAIVGPNGAGKSTTLAAIIGLVAPASGTIEFSGESLLGVPTEQIVRRGIALVLEGRHIFATLTVAENLLLGKTANRKQGRPDDVLERVLEQFPILRRAYRTYAGKLSGGEQQQLAIARALLAEPRLLLLDEPSLGLAPFIVDLVFETLAEIHTSGVTVLIVEQNARRAVEFADRTYVLRSGEVALSGTRDELQEFEALESAYLGG